MNKSSNIVCLSILMHLNFKPTWTCSLSLDLFVFIYYTSLFYDTGISTLI